MKPTKAVDFQGNQRFELMSRLGSGGMGVVYEAFDHERKLRIALKTLRTVSAESLLGLKNEFRALQDIQHPNLVSLGELIEEDGQWFFTMELLHGVNFRQYVRPRQPSAAEEDELLLAHTSTINDSTGSGMTMPGGGMMNGNVASNEPLLPRGFDEIRLRSALGQLAQGLFALHRAQKIHLDIKPSNILVTREGRAVLLDFGLVTDLGRGEASPDFQGAGTVSYMAPEQVLGKQVGPECDWYGVGVLLYEALTGRVPFRGPDAGVIMCKVRFEPTAPAKLVQDVPSDLNGLCMDLLRIDPGARPSGSAVLRRLQISEPGSTPTLSSPMPMQRAPLLGRERELAALRDAFEQARGGAANTIIVRGESGMGKSTLVRNFTLRLADELSQTVVLQGRCHERESVPYKALDGVIDALSRYLMRLPSVEAALLLPRNTGLLAQAFPVLKRVELIAQAPAQQEQVLDRRELRSRVFAAVRELFARLADRHPLVLVIDDFQWADPDSLALLQEILRPPDPPALLLVATLRSQEGTAQEIVLPGPVSVLPLGVLPKDNSEELALWLLEQSPLANPDTARAIAEEAGGHPLFIEELVRHMLGGGRTEGAAFQLEEALWTRIQVLEEADRKLLEVVAVAGVPLPQETVSQASGASDFAKRVSLLQNAHLIRTHGARLTDTIEPYHDRVRSAVVAHLDTELKKSWHERLAIAMETSGRLDAELLAIHWQGAGDLRKAGQYALQAADRAAEILAFDRAARLYKLSLELWPGPEAERWRLRRKLADALANGRRGAEAGPTYLAAAAEAPAQEGLALRRRGAEQLLRSGHVDEGVKVLAEVLGAVDMKLAPTPQRALLSFLLRRMRVRLRGLEFKEHEERDIAPAELTRLDICWSAAQGLAMCDTVRGADFQTQSLLLALQAGEPYRISRALSAEACYSLIAEGPKSQRYEALLQSAEEIAKRIGHPHALGWTAFASGYIEFGNGKFRKGLESCSRAEELFRDRCTDVAWELASLHLFSVWALSYLGQLDELGKRLALYRRQAEERGDLYSATNMRTGLPNMFWLVQGDPDRARHETVEALQQWNLKGFLVQHYCDLYAQGQVDLYVGDSRACLDRTREAWPQLRSSALLRVQQIRINMLHLRARAALLGAQSESDQKGLLGSAERDAKKITKEEMGWSNPLAEMIHAGIAQVRGDKTAALSRLGAAAKGFESAEMALYLATARYLFGSLVGGDEGHKLVSESEGWMVGQGVKEPSRLVAMLAPGFSL